MKTLFVLLLSCLAASSAETDAPTLRAMPRTDQNSKIAHEQLLAKAKQGRIDIYFEGDSITRRWGANDPQYKPLLENWTTNFFGWNAADFGWGADRIENILWRLENGELEGVNPKIIVILAGINNVGNRPGGPEKPAQISGGIKQIVDVCREKAPAATIVLTALFPRNDTMAVIPEINQINEAIAKFADGKKIRFVNINSKIADENGKVFEGMVNPDKLHPTVKTYQIWADALKPIFLEILGPPAAVDQAPPPTGDPSTTKRAEIPVTIIEVAQSNPDASDDVGRPFKTISKAAERAKPGDIIRIHTGTYRERVVVKNSGTSSAPIRFEAVPGDHVVLTGADRLTNWKKKDGAKPIYSVDWAHKFITWNASMTHPADEYHKLIGRCEQVVVNGYLLRQVLDEEQLAPGTFFADVTNKALSVWDATGRDLNKEFVEASVRQEIFRIEGDHVQLRGLNFCYAANMAQHGATVLAGKSNVVEDCVFERMNSSGATINGEDSVVRRCTFRDNGQLGFGASHAHRLLFTDCTVENNNTKNFDRGWEAGGDKLALCRDAVLDHCRFVRNRGNGIWFDIGNTNCTVKNCLIADNDDAGIFYEISFALNAHDNVIVRNGFADTSGAWGAQAGISLSSSPGCVIERNIIVANREGFNFREQKRTTPLIEDRTERPIWNHDQTIRNNIIAYNRDAQVWGWFDVKDNRHWPSNASEGLTLEKLNLRFEQNVYFANPGQGAFNWGPTWSRHEKYATLDQFRSALRVDDKSEFRELPFADMTILDFRIPKDADGAIQAAYPEGSVPGVVLGRK